MYHITHSLSLTVTDTPTDLSVTRLNTSLTDVQVSWSPVSGASGYEVFYSISGSNSVQSAGETSNTMLNVSSGLVAGNTYEFFVVAYGSEDLPSAHSTTDAVSLSKCFHMSVLGN